VIAAGDLANGEYQQSAICRSAEFWIRSSRWPTSTRPSATRDAETDTAFRQDLWYKPRSVDEEQIANYDQGMNGKVTVVEAVETTGAKRAVLLKADLIEEVSGAVECPRRRRPS
jgi:hypothetical protein